MEPLRTGEQVFDFLAGKANAKVYNVYEQYSVAQVAKESGLDIGAKRANKLANLTSEVDSLDSVRESLDKLAQDAGYDDVGSFLAASGQDLKEFGISDREVLRGALGKGKKAQKLAAATKQAGAQAKARSRTELVGQGLSLSDEGRPVAGPRTYSDSL